MYVIVGLVGLRSVSLWAFPGNLKQEKYGCFPTQNGIPQKWAGNHLSRFPSRTIFRSRLFPSHLPIFPVPFSVTLRIWDKYRKTGGRKRDFSRPFSILTVAGSSTETTSASGGCAGRRGGCWQRQRRGAAAVAWPAARGTTAAHGDEEAGEGEDGVGGREAAGAGTPVIPQVVGSDGSTRRGKMRVDDSRGREEESKGEGRGRLGLGGNSMVGKVCTNLKH